MLRSFLDFFIGYRCLKCKNETSAYFADLMMKNNITHRGIRVCSDSTRFVINDIQYLKLLRLGINKDLFVCEYRRGIPYVIQRYRRRPGIVLGIMIIMLLTGMSTRYVWDISVEGNDYLSDAEVLTDLDKLGFKVGSHIPSVDFYGICHRLLVMNPHISWVSVNMEGTRARVVVIENLKKGTPEDGNGSPSNIVARFDGEIVRTESTSGQLSVSVGQRVKAGELLISGIVEIGQGDSGRFTLMRSIGKVYAKTERVFTVEVPFENTETVKKGRKTVKKYLNFFGKSIKLKENSRILDNSCDIITVNRRIVLFENISNSASLPLPLTVTTEYVDVYEEVNISYTEDEAMTLAESKMADAVASELSGAEIISQERSTVITDNSLILTWKITCIQDIGVETPIGLV